jgi:hypothetical protein
MQWDELSGQGWDEEWSWLTEVSAELNATRLDTRLGRLCERTSPLARRDLKSDLSPAHHDSRAGERGGVSAYRP